MKSFHYHKSCKVIHWGCGFDSLLELKYAVSIAKDYAFLRAHIPIYYDPRTHFPTSYIRENIRRYTPDFLVRHKQTKEAFLVETKPRAFETNEQLTVRRKIAENYIRWKEYDWKFKVVFDDEIKLSPDEQEQFNQYRQLVTLSKRKRYLQYLNDKFSSAKPSLFLCAPSNRLIQFVMFGDEKIFDVQKAFAI